MLNLLALPQQHGRGCWDTFLLQALCCINTDVCTSTLELIEVPGGAAHGQAMGAEQMEPDVWQCLLKHMEPYKRAL